MKKTLVAPLALLASLSVISSCSQKETPTPSANTESTQGTIVPEMPAPATSPVNPTPTPAPNPSPSPAPAEVNPIPTPTPTPAPTSSATPTKSSPAQPVVMSRTETVTYMSPAGKDEVEFSVTVTDGVITSASAIPKSTHQVSQKLQTAFAAGVAAKVVGMKTENFDIDAVGGASLTTGAFEVFIRSL